MSSKIKSGRALNNLSPDTPSMTDDEPLRSKRCDGKSDREWR